MRPAVQAFTAVFTKAHPDRTRVRPTIWPTPILNEGYDLAFDILALGTEEPGSDLTVVVQT